MGIEVVFFDVGGPIYADGPYYRALWQAIREASPEASEAAYWEEFERCRVAQDGSFTARLTSRFVEADDRPGVIRRAHELWSYPAEELHADVRPVLEQLDGRYRLGVLANQLPWIRDTLARDGLAGYFDIWAISAELGVEKPDPRIFEHALREAGTSPERCAMVGDRLDNDIVPARATGMRGVWLLRGEAPDRPTADQARRADATILSLAELPETLQGL